MHDEPIDYSKRISELRAEHRELDDSIDRLIVEGGADDLQLKRLKKRKLALKDSIIRLESELIPDLNA